MPIASLDVVLFYGSLGVSLAAVVLFLLLLRRPGKGPGNSGP